MKAKIRQITKRLVMSIAKIIKTLNNMAATQDCFKSTLCIDLYEDGKIIIDNTARFQFSTTKVAMADCTLLISKFNFTRLLSGNLDLSSAVNSGKLKVVGDLNKVSTYSELLFKQPLTLDELKNPAVSYLQLYSKALSKFATNYNLSEPHRHEAHFASL
jgi:putative sterol carrier protein